MLLNDRQGARLHGGEHRLVGPVRLRHEVVQRLMCCLYTPRLHARGHRLDALAITGQQQSRAIRLKRRRAIGVTKRQRDRLNIGGKP